MKKSLSSILLFFLCLSSTYGQQIWESVEERDIARGKINRKLKLNHVFLSNQKNFDREVLTITLPLPEGRNEEFLLKRNRVFPPELAARFPEIKSFDGLSLDGKHQAKVDFTGTTFHASIRTEKGLVYIDPTPNQSNGHYQSYFVKDYKNKSQKPAYKEGLMDRSNSRTAITLRQIKSRNIAHLSKVTSGGELRRYRIAIAANSSYSQFHGGTIQSVLSAIVTTINRVNSVYENDLSISFEIVGNNDELIFLEESSDPFEGVSENQLLPTNRNIINDVVGLENYDIGHLLTTNTGGFARLGVGCTANKAFGTTGISQPVGDPFDIDYVAHELGHQLGGRHTFNGTLGNCGDPGQRSAATAFEPGSGNTIMGYAGICSEDNLQENTDPFFHVNSLAEIINFTQVGDGNTCAVITPTNNTPPSVSIDKNPYVIPIGTPFTLTGAGSDTEDEALTFSWEQLDTGPAGPPDNPQGTAPLFRTFRPSEEGSRTFPRMEDLLNGQRTLGENLPEITRDLNFALVVRDNHPGGGAVNSDNLTISTIETSGPFLVTSQDTEELTYVGGLSQTVTWQVANTNRDPIGVENVRILLSSNGGQSFDHVLSASTANDGIEQVLIPNISSNNARIKIEAIGSIFFNINSQPFSIQQATEPNFSVRASPSPLLLCAREAVTVEVFVDGVGGFNESVTLRTVDLPDAFTASFSTQTAVPGQNVQLTIVNTGGTLDFNGRFLVEASHPTFGTRTQQIALAAFNNRLATFNTTQPADQGINVSTLPTFSWTPVNLVNGYTFQLSQSAEFLDTLFEATNLVKASVDLDFVLEEGTTYYWRTYFENDCGIGELSNASFTTTAFERTAINSGLVNIPISPSGTSTISSTINVNEDITIDDIDVRNLDVTHSWINDLIVVLISPAGTRDTLLSNICNGENNLLINFDDNTIDRDIPCPPVDNETFLPAEPLSVFNGENARGDWTLEISDIANQDGGALNSWSLSIGTLNLVIGLTASTTSTSEISLDWELLETIEGLSGFEIAIKAENEASFSPLTQVDENSRSLNLNNLLPNTRYEFMIRGVVPDGFSSYSAIASARTNPNAPPAPRNLTATLGGDSQILLNWEDNSMVEDGFRLEVSTDGEIWSLASVIPRDEESYLFTEVEQGLTYFFRILAFNITGSSPFSEVASFLVASSGEQEERISIFPNPGSTLLHIESNSIIDELRIVNLTGQSIDLPVNRESTEKYHVDTSSLQSGIYLILLRIGTKTQTFRWVKE